MHNHTTAHDILADLEAKLQKSKRTGDTLRARCPAHDDKTPSLSAKIGDNGDCVVVHCFAGCLTDAVVHALGLKMRDLFATDDAWRSHEARDITDEKDAAKREASCLPRDTPGRVRLWIEALTDADLDAQLRVLHLIAESPEWASLVLALRIAVVGAIKGRTATSMAAAILGRFDDRALTWREPPTEAVDTGVEHFRSIWTYAAEETPDVLIPGLAWRNRVSKISAAPKLGKTSLITNGIAAWQAGQTFLGEQTGPPGSVLYVSETGPAVLRSWFEQYGCPATAPIIVGGAAKVETIAKSAREHKPDLVVIDSLTDLHAASDGGNIWNAGDVRKLIQPLRELGCAVILVHHVRKADGASRDSGDLEAAPDVNISFDPGFKYGGDTPPPGPRRLRYFGRWDEPDRMLTFDKTDGYALANSTGGGGPEGGGSDPFTVVAPVTLLDEKVTGYLMQHAASSGRQIRAALECQLRDLRPSLTRLSATGRIACDTGPRSAKLWSVTTSGSPPATPMFEPVEPVLVHATGSVNVYGVEPVEPVLVHPVQTLVNQTPEPDDLNQSPEPDDLHGGDLPLAGSENTPPPSPQGGAANRRLW